MYDIERIKRWLASPILRKILPFAVVILCLLGVGLMVFGRFGQGLALWFVSLVAGALVLFVHRTLQKKLRDLEEEEARS